MDGIGDKQEIAENDAGHYDLVLQYAQEALNDFGEFREQHHDDELSLRVDEMDDSSSPNLNESTTNEKGDESPVQDNDRRDGSDTVLDKEDTENHYGCRQCRAEAKADAKEKSPHSSPSENNSWYSGDELRSKRTSTSSLVSQAFFSPASQNPKEEKKKKKKKVGHYLLEQTIGEGSYAKVHVATHLLTRQKVAVKVVTKKTLVLNDASRHHFRREALLLPRLGHPNVIKLYEAMETPNSYYLVFELVGGGHLLTLVSQKGNLTEEESRVFMKQIVSAVDHLHQSDIVHRDIRLENVLVDGNNKVKLVDFGFSTVCHMKELTTQCGCPVYAAPEVFAGRRYGRPVDIWSLGICFYGMLLGRLPFLPVSNSLSQLFSIILKGCLIPTHLTPSCQDLLSRMLDHQEGRRITVDEILLHHWLTFPDGQPIRRHPSIPKRLNTSNVDQHVVKYMCSTFRFNETDIMNSVIERRLTSSAATYHILREKMNAAKERRGQTPLTYKAPDRSRMPQKTTTSAITSLPAVTSSGVSSAKPISPSKESASNKHGHHRAPGRSKSPNRKAQTSDASSAYKSYILVLKQSRLGGTEPTMSNYESPAKETYFDLIRRSPPFFTVESGNSPTMFPAVLKSDSTSIKHYMRIDKNNQADLGVTGTSPLIHDRVSSMDYNAPGPAMSSATNSRSSTTLRPFTVKAPPPVPPNSSLGIEAIDMRPKSPGIQHTQEDLSTPSRMLITNNKTVPLSNTPPKSNAGPPFPSLSSLRESFAVDTWNRSRLNVRLRPKPTVSLLRSKKSEPTKAEIRVQGRSQQRIDDKDSRTFDGYVTWAKNGDSRRNSEDDSDIGIGKSLDKVTTFLDSLPTSDPEPFVENRGQDSETAAENGFQRSITLASVPAKEKSNQNNALTDAMVRIVSMHTATRSDSPHLFRSEMESSLSQSLEKDDFMTPVTRVTITTIQKDS